MRRAHSVPCEDTKRTAAAAGRGAPPLLVQRGGPLVTATQQSSEVPVAAAPLGTTATDAERVTAPVVMVDATVWGALLDRVTALEAQLNGPAASLATRHAVPSSVLSWTASDVHTALCKAGLASDAALLWRHGITGGDLADLTHADLLSIGIARLDARKRILRAVNMLVIPVQL